MDPGDRFRNVLYRLRRVERRELREFRVWLETTRNLVHLTLVLAVPLLIGLVTFLSNTLSVLPFLLFPPLAAGTYTLFADPRGEYASPRKFVGGLTLGAVCGYAALWAGTLLYPADPTGVHAGSAALAVFLTGLVTWGLDLEVPSAFSTALLTLVAGPSIPGIALGSAGGALLYVLSVFGSSLLVAGVFVVYRRQFYQERARYLYESTKGDDHVLVPLRGDGQDATAMLAARIAAAHEAGKVVLLDLVDEGRLRTLEGDETGARPVDRVLESVAADVEQRASEIRTRTGVPCEVVVAESGTNPAGTVISTAHATNCDLIAVSYETRHGALSPFVKDLFSGDTDVVVHRSFDGRTHWRDVLVPVRGPSDAAHAMADIAARLVGRTGRVALANCISAERERRRAESMLATLAETVSASVETRVARSTIERFLATNAAGYDMVVIGSSRERSAASRFISPPTFERIRELEADVVVLDRNYRV